MGKIFKVFSEVISCIKRNQILVRALLSTICMCVHVCLGTYIHVYPYTDIFPLSILMLGNNNIVISHNFGYYFNCLLGHNLILIQDFLGQCFQFGVYIRPIQRVLLTYLQGVLFTYICLEPSNHLWKIVHLNFYLCKHYKSIFIRLMYIVFENTLNHCPYRHSI